MNTRKDNLYVMAFLCALVMLVARTGVAGENLVQNGTFEGRATQHAWGGYWDSEGFSCPGWKFEGLSGLAKSDGVWVTENLSVGEYAMILQPWKDAAASQVIPCLPAGDYRLSFNYTARPRFPGKAQVWLGKTKLGEVESDTTMRSFTTDFALAKSQTNVLLRFFSPARNAERDIAIENVVLQRLDAFVKGVKYPDLLTAMIHAGSGDTIIYSPAGGDVELKDGAVLAWNGNMPKVSIPTACKVEGTVRVCVPSCAKGTYTLLEAKDLQMGEKARFEFFPLNAVTRASSLKVDSGKLILIVGTTMCTAHGKSDAADAGLLPAEIGLGWENGWVKEWVRDVPGLTVTDVRTSAGDGFERVVRRWVWHGEKPLEKVTLSVRYRMKGDPKALKPFLPGVLLYGNPSNRGIRDGRVPVYFGGKGEFGIFEEHRLPMPFSLLENAGTGDFAALHVWPSAVKGVVHSDQWWSAGVEARDDGADIVLLSGPAGFNGRRSTVKGIPFDGGWTKYDEAYITLQPEKPVEKLFWIQTGKATKDAFGFQQAARKSLDIFQPERALVREVPLKRIMAAKRNYTLTRWREDPANGMCGFTTFCKPRPNMVYHQPVDRYHNSFGLGWVDQSEACSFGLAVMGVTPDDRVKAQRSLDAIADAFSVTIRPDGRFSTGYRFGGQLPKKGWGVGSIVNCGMALDSIIQAVIFADAHPEAGLKNAKWKAFVKKSLTALAGHVMDKNWRGPHNAGDGYLVPPLVMGSEVFGDPQMLAAAERIADALAKKFISYESVYFGATLDARCEDGESCQSAFMGFEALLRSAVKRGDKDAAAKWERCVRHALEMSLTYMVSWDIPMPEGSDLFNHSFRATGWTMVSPQNQCMDCLGAIEAPATWRMGAYWNDRRLQDIAKIRFASGCQLLDEEGAAGENIQMTNFGNLLDNHSFPRRNSDASKFRGVYRDSWEMLWMTAIHMKAGCEFMLMGVDW